MTVLHCDALSIDFLNLSFHGQLASLLFGSRGERVLDDKVELNLAHLSNLTKLKTLRTSPLTSGNIRVLGRLDQLTELVISGSLFITKFFLSPS